MPSVSICKNCDSLLSIIIFILLFGRKWKHGETACSGVLLPSDLLVFISGEGKRLRVNSSSRKDRHIQQGRKQQSNTHETGHWTRKQRPRCPTKPTTREVVGCRAGRLRRWIKHQCCQKETKWLSEEEIRSGAAGDTETVGEAQDLGQRKTSRAEHQLWNSRRGTERRCRDGWAEKRDRQAIKQEQSGYALGEEMFGNQKTRWSAGQRKKFGKWKAGHSQHSTEQVHQSIAKEFISSQGLCQMLL